MFRSLNAFLSYPFGSEDRSTRELRAYARSELKAEACYLIWQSLKPMNPR